MRELNVAVVGCGMLAQATHLPHLNAIEGARLRWACDRNPEVLAAVAKKFQPERTTADYSEIMLDAATDAIVLAATHSLRLPVISAAARAGKGVYCEKPIAGTLEEMEEIRRIVTESGLIFCAGHNRRSAPAMEYAYRAFTAARQRTDVSPWRLDRNSRLRAPVTEERQMTMLIRINDDILSWKPWAFDDIDTNGPMLFEMTHFTDLAVRFFGERPVRVTAIGHLRCNQSVNVLFADGSLATIFMNGVGTFSYPKELYELYVNGSAVVIDHLLEVRCGDVPGFSIRKTFPFAQSGRTGAPTGDGIREWCEKRRLLEERAEREGHDGAWLLAQKLDPDKGHRRHLELFLDAVRGTGTSPCPVEDAIIATRVAFAAIESLKTGRPVNI